MSKSSAALSSWSDPRHQCGRPTVPDRQPDPGRSPTARDRGRPQRLRRFHGAALPALGPVVAGDVAFNNVHQYLADGGFTGGIDAWLRALDMVRDLQPAAVVAGHKDPGRTDDPRILDESTEYLYTSRQVLAEKPTAREFFDEMTRRYPDRLNPSTV